MATTVVLAIKVDGEWKETTFECKNPQWRIAFKTMKDSGYPIRLIYR
jgi:hypothetical protein